MPTPVAHIGGAIVIDRIGGSFRPLKQSRIGGGLNFRRKFQADIPGRVAVVADVVVPA